MSVVFAVAGWVIFSILAVIALGLNLLGLFGNWVILGATVLLWAATGFDHFGLSTWMWLVGLASLGEVLEFLAAGVGASRFGGGKGAITASLIGCIIGAIMGSPVFPVIGTLAGAFAGAFVGPMLYELLVMEKKAGEAAWTGFGAALGKLGGTLVKTLLGVIMLIIVALTYS